MAQPTRPSMDDAGHASVSLGHLLLVWVLVGASLARLGTTLHRSTAAAIPLTEVSTGLLLGTVAVAVLWATGFRPPVTDAVLYFVTEQAGYLLLAVALLGSETGPLLDAGVHALSISGAAAFSFTDTGRETRGWLREQAWRLLKTQTVD
jgi:hypothetical protein